jgi:hypothetical protein
MDQAKSNQRFAACDDTADILWRDTNGDLAIWLMNGLEIVSTGWLGMVPALTGDFDCEGGSDPLRDTATGATAIWFMNGVQISQAAGVAVVSTSWAIQRRLNRGRRCGAEKLNHRH